MNTGDELPGRVFETDTIGQFLYNAALWNAHRIHFDQPYATDAEGYPGLVVAGPLMGDWLTQVVTEWLTDGGRLVRFGFSNRKAAFVGETLRSGGSVRAIDRATGLVELDLFIKNDNDEIITPGTAVIELPVG